MSGKVYYPRRNAHKSPKGLKYRETVMTDRIAFQGEPGTYSHEACRDARPDMEALPCHTFEEVIAAVRSGEARLAMLVE